MLKEFVLKLVIPTEYNVYGVVHPLGKPQTPLVGAKTGVQPLPQCHHELMSAHPIAVYRPLHVVT
jgi:hypothetical protein